MCVCYVYMEVHAEIRRQSWNLFSPSPFVWVPEFNSVLQAQQQAPLLIAILENLPPEEFGAPAQTALLVVCKPAFSGAVSSADSGANCGSGA